MNPIGGFFELELNSGKEYHSTAVKLNLSRSGLEYIIRAKKIKKIFMPYYTCEVMISPLARTNTNFEFYHIDENFEPIFEYSNLIKTDFFLYTNYFGIKDKFISKLADKKLNLIIDNSQSFFSKSIPEVDLIYSPRKFFGVPDGGYLYTNCLLHEKLELDNSSNRFKHLIGRIENGAEASYNFFKENDEETRNEPIKEMSNITRKLLSNIDYNRIAKIRKENFIFLHERLQVTNKVSFDLTNESVPMVYPFLNDQENLRNDLIKNKIFVAQYWPNVLEWVKRESIEFEFATKMIFLPIDQRYNENDMNYITSFILNKNNYGE